ncbi:MAG: BlaI/MecI/CopY family transcriptional regulator [Tannerellaceae bacterium]|jgi:predicted transcriptional regulator|nr:BlaI/MecI/CopY family transcriptional regulator [Tannerellaceae bacterium]
MERLTAQEEEVMLYIWKLDSCFIRDILNEMPDPKPPYTSIASVVRNLERKEYVSSTKFGIITQFTPIIRESEYKRAFMSNVVRDYFTGSYKEMVSFFVRDRKISRSDLEELMCQIEDEK